uniref:Uncharacterized protein n=1 Tax=Schizaphis graminum TaxID=13262 RepID=A0A2S2PR64_SCHGA
MCVCVSASDDFLSCTHTHTHTHKYNIVIYMYKYKSSARRRRRRQPTLLAAPYMERRVSATTTTTTTFGSIQLSCLVGWSFGARGAITQQYVRASITGRETSRDILFYHGYQPTWWLIGHTNTKKKIRKNN